MTEEFETKILEHLQSTGYEPQRPRSLAEQLDVPKDEIHAFRDSLRRLMDEGRVVLGARGAILLPTQRTSPGLITGTYRHNKRGFGFVVPTDPASHADLFIPPGDHGGAITGDIVGAKITSQGQRDGKTMYTGRVTEIKQRTNKQFVGTLTKVAGEWVVMPDGNMFTEVILAPDAASRHIRVGTKVVIELTTYPEEGQRAQGVITEVLGEAGQKDVDLKSIIAQYNLPSDFPEEVKAQARRAVDTFDPHAAEGRLDLTGAMICTIDPDDAKDYDDAISLRQLEDGRWQLGVHIADVSHFVPAGSPLDEEAHERGNSSYFPGYVIPMLPEILSNGVCSLQEGVPRLCKSAFITYDENARPVATKFANTVIRSAQRLRYREAQALIDHEAVIPHPEGDRKREDYPPAVLELLDHMNVLSRRLQARRKEQGQLNLDLPEVDLVLDEDGKVTDAVAEDQSFTHTLIEMFMVEANEAVARLLDSLDVPFLRRKHPEPDLQDTEKLRTFVQVSGYKLPKQLDRKEIQKLLAAIKGKPEAFAINLAVLKSLTRAEYSPEAVGHFALASEHYCHFTSPIRRYADLTIHRLLDAYFAAREHSGERGKGRKKAQLNDVPTYDDLVTLGKHISYTERRSEDAERELRQVKILELLKDKVGEEFDGVVTGITNFGVFIQLSAYLCDGLIRYEDLMDDWWDVDERSGLVRAQRSGQTIRIGDVAKVRVIKVDLPRRELSLAITEIRGRTQGASTGKGGKGKGARGAKAKTHRKPRGKVEHRGGTTARNQRSKNRSRRGK